tara:strand:+ start:838 stop:1053 length:216 start_codon:yes stop_codon:yes gene_type:complete
MKVERTNKDFQPIELSITIETEQELHDLYARVNVDALHVNEGNFNIKYKSDDDSLDDLHNILHDILNELNT